MSLEGHTSPERSFRRALLAADLEATEPRQPRAIASNTKKDDVFHTQQMRIPSRNKREDRLFVRDGRRHYRRRYSRNEVRAGLSVLGILALLTVWIAWKGANPDPELMGSNADLLASQDIRPTDRGPLPTGLAASGWTEGPVSQFNADNLYEKINGREDYYKSFGFQGLYFLSIVSDTDPSVAVDIEMYDLGETPNALGAYAGERPPNVSPEIGPSGMGHLHRNALLMTRGKFYVRAIGSDETQPVLEQLAHLERSLGGGLPGEDLPPEYAIFVGGLSLDPGRVSYTAENAYSFGFARDVYSALLEDGETEIFVISSTSAEEAESLASQFTDGFLGYGTPAGESTGVQWVKDRYIGTISGAMGERTWLMGVRGAPDLGTAEVALGKLREAIQMLNIEGTTG